MPYSVEQCFSMCGRRAVSKEEALQKLYQTLNEWKIHVCAKTAFTCMCFFECGEFTKDGWSSCAPTAYEVRDCRKLENAASIEFLHGLSKMFEKYATYSGKLRWVVGKFVVKVGCGHNGVRNVFISGLGVRCVELNLHILLPWSIIPKKVMGT
jgi:hypothetical protein